MRKYNGLAFGFAMAVIFAVSSSNAEKSASDTSGVVSALSFHDVPKYAENFSQYDFANPKAKKGGIIKLISIGSFDCANRTFKCTPPDGMELTEDSLMTRSLDEPFTLYANVAEKVEMANDGSWIEFHLNPKAKWHDGRPITVEDVIYTLETKKEKGLPSARLYYGRVGKIEKTGEQSVKMTVKKPETGSYNRELPFILAMMSIVPKHYYEGNGIEIDAPTQKPHLTSGPYKIKQVNPGRYVEYERVPEYWGKDLPSNNGRYNFDTIRYEYFRDTNAALQAFKSAQVDVVRESIPSKWEKSHQGPKYKDGTLKKIELKNENPVGMRAFSFNTRKPLFQDVRVREALNLVFDRAWVTSHILPGFKNNISYFDNTDLAVSYGKPSKEEIDLIKSIDPDYDTRKLTLNLPSKDQRANMRKAYALLKEAGWALKDGVLTNNKTGKPFEFELIITQPDEQKLALAFVRNLKELGINVRVSLVDAAQYEHRKQNRNYDMIATWWATSISPGNELQLYWSCAAKDNPGSRNYPGICDPVADKIMELIPTLQTRKDLKIHTKALDRILLSNNYLVPLFYNPTVYLGLHKKIEYRNSVVNPIKDLQFWWANPDK